MALAEKSTNQYDRAWGFGDIVRYIGEAHHIFSGREGEIVEIGNQGVKVRLFDSSHTPDWAWGTFELLRSAADTKSTKQAMIEEAEKQARADAEIAQAREDELAQADYRFTGQVKHYNGHPSGIECQEIIRECNDPMVAFAMKHLWRSQWGQKPGAPKTLDFEKAIEYLQLELARQKGQARL